MIEGHDLEGVTGWEGLENGADCPADLPHGAPHGGRTVDEDCHIAGF